MKLFLVVNMLMLIKKLPSVHFLSNYANPSNNVVTIRNEKYGTVQRVDCPLLVAEYNKNMGYVNKKSKKWYHLIFRYLLDMVLVNLYLIFKHRSNASQLKKGKTITLRNFKIAYAWD
ncbi:hypothetical protein NQ318_014723 [Aromia moschata]|uniref:PiggyBac transposable element-derived protein domain-containing protein n=1 Tax=Aromia moschata TaxID=1265417 RepID=A0AAV8ZB18_9CUCU|nr:hypothetical protein NQ318_014723 [Aromia moschata]